MAETRMTKGLTHAPYDGSHHIKGQTLK